MKSVLISIKPKWCEKIASGEKTIEVRKSAPHEVPFKAYIYCTKQKTNGEILLTYERKIEGRNRGFRDKGDIPLAGKVIGEFICDKIEDFYCASVPYQKENNLGYGRFVDNGVYKVDGWHEGIVFERNDRFIDSMLNNNVLKEMCLFAQELFDYIGIGKHLYGWHISDLKIYDKPKKLSKFKISCNRKNLCYSCNRFTGNPWDICNNTITRPPQSYMFVEEI